MSTSEQADAVQPSSLESSEVAPVAGQFGIAAERAPTGSRLRVRGGWVLIWDGALFMAAVFWLIPLLWGIAAAFDTPVAITANGWGWIPTQPTLHNFTDAWQQGDFATYYINTFIIVGGIILIQAVTVSLAGYAFARYDFAGKRVLFTLYLLQIMVPITALVLPNYQTMSTLHLIDTKWAIMLPYFASGFGTFLMRQAFRGVPRELEDAAVLDGASWWRLIWHVYLPLTRPSLAAFALVSIAFHWNDFFWPLIATNSAASRPISVGLALLTASVESGTQWNLIMAGMLLVVLPLLLVFLVFQRAFINSFARSGLR